MIIVTINERVRDQKLPCNFYREAEKTSSLTSGKIEKYKYFTGEEVLPQILD